RAGNFRWLLIATFFLACASCGYTFSRSSFFALEQVIISGNQAVSAERLRHLSDVEMGRNIFTVDVDQVRQRLLIEPFVASAQVQLRLPRTININISERQPAAVLATGHAFVQIDNTGLVLRRMRELDTVRLPILSGANDFPVGIMPGGIIEGEGIELALTILNMLPELSVQSVTEIDVTDSQKIRLYTTGGIEVRVGGPTDIAEKYVMAANIIYDAQMNGKAADIHYIDISSTEKPVINYY
ncbi:MAG: FtsQ-type POTRA domain-containing protein, partial [Clostridiales bacterium]|nr:FtsQ-type POTRA domain-containing protein [Clostridiales bacterium]